MPRVSKPDHLDAQREIIRLSLDRISDDIGMALRDAGLTFPVFITVPASGDAVAMIATPLDPPDQDWSRAMENACRVVQRKVDSGKLRTRALVFAAINTTMTCADVAVD